MISFLNHVQHPLNATKMLEMVQKRVTTWLLLLSHPSLLFLSIYLTKHLFPQQICYFNSLKYLMYKAGKMTCLLVTQALSSGLQDLIIATTLDMLSSPTFFKISPFVYHANISITMCHYMIYLNISIIRYYFYIFYISNIYVLSNTLCFLFLYLNNMTYGSTKS